MIQILCKPYPYTFSLRNEIIYIWWIGIFVSVFLIFFQPFGINLWVVEYRYLKLSGFGFVSFIIPCLLYILRYLFVNERLVEYNYKVWHEIVWLLLILLAIAAGNMLYSNFIEILTISQNSFLLSLSMVLSIGVFPILGSIWLKYYRFNALNSREASDIEKTIITSRWQVTSDRQLISFVAENERDQIIVDACNLLYIESMDNYSMFVFLKDGNLVKQTLRGSLRFFESNISIPAISRCHRSFIVNLYNVVHIEGNAQGYILTLNHDNLNVPVSRKYGPIIKEMYNKMLVKRP